ncbi:hypothetical protein [Actinocatenispora comari]|uniref:Uncharacterized protein n=1 Tax=Actinocatenispora comari TaxID=2807577 RepID=A0A8J4EP46_9ACTN|nr:hypothetical protein [Actinocatenispora comari]GIL28374.1 hypothetical protein NUM_36280 [Actinocatenispora comari]
MSGMFMQIIQGKVGDAGATMATLERWHQEVEPGATGFLGSTYGISDDGTCVIAVRFESAEAAERNSRRAEQSQWWARMERNFVDGATFHDCDDVTMLLSGGRDDAGFVQVIQGRVHGRERLHTLVEQSGDLLSRYRPDVVGATVAIDADGCFTETVAFTSEAAAREAERAPRPPDAARVIDEEMSHLDDVHYIDLREPRFVSG